jgi:hypothetical protein
MDKPLSRFEAQLVAEWMSTTKVKINWTTVWRLRPSEVAKKFEFKKDDVIKAARRSDDLARKELAKVEKEQ